MRFPKRNQRWTNDEHEKLKSIFLEQAVMFNPSKFGFEMGRSSTSITTRITCMINPLDKMYDEGLDKDGFDNSLDTLGLHTSDDDLFSG